MTALSALSLSDYWLFTDRGRAIPFGDPGFYGGLPELGLVPNGPVLDSIPTPTGGGYYMVGSDGGIFAFGDAGSSARWAAAAERTGAVARARSRR